MSSWSYPRGNETMKSGRNSLEVVVYNFQWQGENIEWILSDLSDTSDLSLILFSSFLCKHEFSQGLCELTYLIQQYLTLGSSPCSLCRTDMPPTSPLPSPPRKERMGSHKWESLSLHLHHFLHHFEAAPQPWPVAAQEYPPLWWTWRLAHHAPSCIPPEETV